MTQTHATHRRYFPWHHFVVQPILIINVGLQISRLSQGMTFEAAWRVVFGLGLLLLSFTARSMALKVQDRVIRLEERLRLARLMPAADQAMIEQLTKGQLVALRFASDEELPDLARRAATGELAKPADIKTSIRNWRPDYLRV